MGFELWLHVSGVNPKVWAYLIRRGRQTIGRSDECDVKLDHRSVSRRHAELRWERSGLTIRDLDSANGTFVNGSAAGTATLEAGDRLRLGHVTLEVIARALPNSDPVDETEETDSVPSSADERVPAAGRLSPSDSKVLKLLLRGLSEKRVAGRLRISPQTAHWRVKRIYQALGVHSRAQLLALFVRPTAKK